MNGSLDLRLAVVSSLREFEPEARANAKILDDSIAQDDGGAARAPEINLAPQSGGRGRGERMENGDFGATDLEELDF